VDDTFAQIKSGRLAILVILPFRFDPGLLFVAFLFIYTVYVLKN
jgi:hypothetical protein